MNPDIEQLKQRIVQLEDTVKLLKAASTIPFEIDTAFRERFGIDSLAQLSTSDKTAASETQSVDEGGVSSYSVAKPMDGFKEFVTAGQTFYIPYYT